MQEKKSLVQEALIQMKNVEEAIAENAKGILAATMQKEINQLVKESLSEQEEDDESGVETDTDVEDMDVDDMDADTDVDNDDMDDTMDLGSDDMSMDSGDSPIDLTGASDDVILKVFKAMGENDGIIVKKDGDNVTLKDDNADVEYLVKLGESEEDTYNMDEMDNTNLDEENDVDTQDVIDAIFSDKDSSDFGDDMDNDNLEEDDVMYEISLDDEELDEQDEEMDEEEEVMYEISLDDENLDEQEEEMDEQDEEMDEQEEEESYMDESYNPKKGLKKTKAKGVGMGSPKFSYKKTVGGFKEDMKQGPKSVGTGKAKFEYKKDGGNVEGKAKLVKKVETKEAARTYGFGSKEGRGLRKGITPNRNLKMESLEAEVSMLNEKNQEYRKALNIFREKLNEVAIFNSNLAYATRLFTEHSTTKKEKINILRRFDGVETLKESKSLYKSVKEELSKSETGTVNESVEKKLNKTVTTGSSTTLIESKTYENPQFLRMKDLMGKLG